MYPRIRFTLCTSALALISGLALAQAPAVPAAGSAALAGVQPVIECEKLVAADISPAVGAPTHITSAKVLNEAKPAAYCEVLGYIEPSIKFEVRLPLTNWTQRFLQTGCGGLCGEVSIRADRTSGCAPATNGEIAMSSTDMGHVGGMADDGSWGSKDYQLRVDFAYRGVHLTTLASKALIAAYYGQAPKYSYFAGCSDGGREALMEAQRFPEDFDGITAGAAAMNFTTQNTFYHGWNANVNTDAKGNTILGADKLPLLHQIALDQCDALDGVKDGLISTPLLCHPDLTVAECKKKQNPASCLTHEQIRVANEIYAGAHTADGAKMVLSGPMPGSELGWAGVLIPPAPGVPFYISKVASESALKHLVYEKDPAANYTLKDLAFTKENFVATTQLHGLFDATDPDLTPFASKGGKLILFHGWADPHISPINTIAYYTNLQKLLGKDKVDQFTRLYLFPGGYHCGGGEGPFEYPLMAAIMAWVENGQAPNMLIASHAAESHRGPILGVPGNASGGAMLPPLPPLGKDGKLPPLPAGGLPPMGPGGPGGIGPDAPDGAAGPEEPAKVDRTRPVFPYPYTAKYIGSGDINDARNFVQGDAQPIDPARLEWLGAEFYTPHYQKWCTGKGTTLTCTDTPQK